MARRRPAEATAALFVRLPVEEADRLERAAAALGAPKKDVVRGLVARYVDPDRPEELRDAVAAAGGRPVRLPLPGELALGHADLRPPPASEVLTAAEAAELLQVAEEEVVALAEAGELPGRRIGAAWRFARAAVLAWLGGD